MKTENFIKSKERDKILDGKADLVDLFDLKGELLKSGHFKFKAVSWCMFPVLKKGDILKIEPVCMDDIKIGDIPVYRSGDGLYAHRIVDKQPLNGKQFIITMPDEGAKTGGIKTGTRVSAENILGKVVEIKRGRKKFPLEKRQATAWEKFLHKKATTQVNLVNWLKNTAKIILAGIQSLKFYKVLGGKFTAGIKKHLNFELAIPFSSRALKGVCKYIRLDHGGETDFSELKKAKIFHLVAKFGNTPVGYASFLNRPDNHADKRALLRDLYIRLRYKELGFDSILLQKAKEVLKEAKIDSANLVLPTEKPKHSHFIDNTEELLLICARQNLSRNLIEKAKGLLKNEIDWDFFTSTAMRSGLSYLFYNSLNTINSPGIFPKDISDKLKNGYLRAIPKATSQYRETANLLKLFFEKNIPAVPLKGPILSKRLYGDIAARGPSVDIDLLIEEKNKGKARKALEEAGYSFNSSSGMWEWFGQYIFGKKGSAIVDLHWEINPMASTSERMKGFWKGTRLEEEKEVRFYEFKEEELLLQLSAHLVQSAHLIELRYISDVNELLSKYRNALDWKSIIEKAKKWKLSGSVYITLVLSRLLFGSYVPDGALAGLRPGFPKRILVKILADRRVILRRSSRRRQLIERFLKHILFQLLEAQSVKDYFRIFFPPKEGLGSKTYFKRLARGIAKLVKGLS